MARKVYKKTDAVNFFTIEKFVMFNEYKVDFPLPYPPERHDFFEFQYVIKGSRTSKIDGKEIVIKPGQYYMVPPGVVHSLFSAEDDTECFIMGFTVLRTEELYMLSSRVMELSEDEKELVAELAEESRECFELMPETSVDSGSRIRDGITKGRVQTLKNRVEIFFIKLIEAQMMESDGKNFISHRMSIDEKVMSFLKTHVTERVTLSRIAEELSLSVPYIRREFTKKYGRGIIDYFIDMKIERAKQLIEETPLNFTQIAEYLSFESESHFSKTFSKRMGMTPGAYLKRIKE
ncbi:MAG: helix-turn-helix transcriptional regulator [Oscillospiraceae bacterium]|nr:helix-turn-helix transcriptional regulator [Oscillospiraceae bacterium]